LVTLQIRVIVNEDLGCVTTLIQMPPAAQPDNRILIFVVLESDFDMLGIHLETQASNR